MDMRLLRCLRLFLVAFAVVLLTTEGTWAQPITFSFTGTVTDDPFGLSTFGAPISGSYTFGSAATDSIPAASTGSYASSGAGFGFTANVGSTPYAVLGSLAVDTANNTAGVDQYGAIALNGALTLELFFQDATGTALGSDALPLLPPPISGFAFRQFRLFSADAEFLGSVTSLTCSLGCTTQVPEPSSLMLMLGAALALGFLTTARKKTTAATDRRRDTGIVRQ